MSESLISVMAPRARSQFHRESSASIIRLVESQNSSRKFLHILNPPHLNLPNFDELIKETPFKQHSVEATSKSGKKQCTFKIPSFSYDELPKDKEENLFKAGHLRSVSNGGSFKGVLKNGSKSRFWKEKGEF